MAIDKTQDETSPTSKSASGFIPLSQLIAEIDKESASIPGDTQPQQSPVGTIGSDFMGQGQYIRFFLEDILLAIPLSSALEIGHWPEITPLPNLPEWVLGVSNVRGEIVSMVDLKGFFGIPSPVKKRNRRFIITYHGDLKVGLIVDRVMGIFYLDRSNMEIQMSPYDHGEISAYISGVVTTEDVILNILDIDKLLLSPKMNAFGIE